MEPEKKKCTSVHFKMCPKLLKCMGDTTNLWYHLQYSHCEQYKSMIEAEEPKKEASRKHAAATVEGDSTNAC